MLATLSPLILSAFADSEGFVEPEITLLYTDKKQYTDKDLIKITGQVSTLDSPTVLVGIYDPFGVPAGFYIVSIDSDLEFSTSFPVKAGVNFRIDGTYSIKAHYAETEATYFFDYDEISQSVIEDIIEDTVEEEIKENTHIEEKIVEPSDEIISDVTNISSDEKIINKEKTNDNYNSIDENSIINDSKKIAPQTEIKKQTNLTVEDIELGKLLNQINLKCDSSTFTDTISYYDGMGPALYRLCKFDSSLNFFNDSLINNPNNVEILVNKGSALGKLGYFSEAIMYYDQAINIDPDFLPAKNNKANALTNLGNFDEAILLYNEILVKNPNYTTARENLETTLSETTLSETTLSETTLSETTLSETTLSETTLSETTLSETTLSETTLSETTLSETTLSETVEFETEKIVYQQSTLPEKTISFESKKQKSTNFFEELSTAFSYLGSLFGFLN